MQAEQAMAAQRKQSSGNDQESSSADGNSFENIVNETIIPLNDVKEGTPVFFVHGAGGGVLVLRKIMQKVQAPVYGIQDTPEAPLTGTMDNLANFYLEKVRKIQSKGPYRIGGFSFGMPRFLLFILLVFNMYLVLGAGLALLLAQMLHAAGETVEMLFMLEGSPTIFHLPTMRESLRKTIMEGTISKTVSGSSHCPYSTLLIFQRYRF